MIEVKLIKGNLQEANAYFDTLKEAQDWIKESNLKFVETEIPIKELRYEVQEYVNEAIQVPVLDEDGNQVTKQIIHKTTVPENLVDDVLRENPGSRVGDTLANGLIEVELFITVPQTKAKVTTQRVPVEVDATTKEWLPEPDDEGSVIYGEVGSSEKLVSFKQFLKLKKI